MDVEEWGGEFVEDECWGVEVYKGSLGEILLVSLFLLDTGVDGLVESGKVELRYCKVVP